MSKMASTKNPSGWGGQLLAGCLLYGFYHAAEKLDAPFYFSWMFAGLAGLLFILSLFGLIRHWQWHRALSDMKEPSGIFGTAIDPDLEDVKQSGLMLENPENDSFLIAAKDGQLIFCKTDSHACILGTNGAGKSASIATPIALSLDTNAIFTGKGIEVYLAARKWRAENFGHEIRHWNPYNLGNVGCDNINLLDDLFPFVAADDPEALDIAAGKALLLIPIPKAGGGENAFFLNFARALLGPLMNYAVWYETENGMQTGNLPYLHKQVCGSIDELRGYLLQMACCDAFEGSIAQAAKRFLSLLDSSPKTAMSVLGFLSNALASFDPASKIGKSIMRSDFDVHDITKNKMSLFFSNEPSKVQNSPAVGLAIEMFIGISLRDQRKDRRPLHFVLDEFGNLCGGPIPGISPLLYLGRSLKTRGIFFVQSTSIFDRYEEPGAFISQSACFLATAIRDVDDAEFLSKRSGQYSAIVENVSLPVNAGGGISQDYSISLPEQAVPNKRSDEILQLKDYTGLLYYRQNPPVSVDLVHYQSVQQWRDYAEDNEDITVENVPVKYRLND